jgi:hypothetical protein
MTQANRLVAADHANNSRTPKVAAIDPIAMAVRSRLVANFFAVGRLQNESRFTKSRSTPYFFQSSAPFFSAYT